MIKMEKLDMRGIIDALPLLLESEKVQLQNVPNLCYICGSELQAKQIQCTKCGHNILSVSVGWCLSEFAIGMGLGILCFAGSIVLFFITKIIRNFMAGNKYIPVFLFGLLSFAFLAFVFGLASIGFVVKRCIFPPVDERISYRAKRYAARDFQFYPCATRDFTIILVQAVAANYPNGSTAEGGFKINIHDWDNTFSFLDKAPKETMQIPEATILTKMLFLTAALSVIYGDPKSRTEWLDRSMKSLAYLSTLDIGFKLLDRLVSAANAADHPDQLKYRDGYKELCVLIQQKRKERILYS